MLGRWLTVITSIGVLLLSCSSKKQEGSNLVTLSLWQFWTDPQVKPVFMELLKKFEGENPGIKVEVTDLTWANGHEKIVVAFGSKSGPDVVELGSDWVPEFAYQGALYDMTYDVDSLKVFYRMWEPAIVGNRYYAFPWILDTRVLFYNKDLLKKAGFEPERELKTWGELLEAAQKIHDPSNKIYGFGANSAEKHRLYKKFLPFLWGNDGQILSPDGKVCLLNSQQGREALEFYVNLTKYGLIDTQLRLDEAFMNGKLGFVISGGWLLQQIRKDKPELSFGVSLLPRPGVSAGVRASFAGGEFLAVNAKSKYPGQAMKLVRFLADLDNALLLCKAIGTPSPAHAMASLDPYYVKDPYLSVFQEQMNYSYTPPATPQWVYIEEQIEKAVEKAMYGKKTPQEALNEAKQQIDELLKKQSGKKFGQAGLVQEKLSSQEAQKIIASRASQVVFALKRQDLKGLSGFVHPQKGVRFSPYGYVDPEKDLVFKSKEIERQFHDQKKYTWGDYDGSGQPIALTFQEYYKAFIYDLDFMQAPKIGYNLQIGRGNTGNNIFQVYPGCIFVEYHIPGMEEKYQGMDWRSLRLVFEEREGSWYLVGVVHDQWTI